MRFTTLMMITVLGAMILKADAQNISYSGKNISLLDFFSAITSQTGYAVFYNNEVILQSHRISLNLKNASLQSALDEAFGRQPLTYKIQGNTIFVSVKQISNKAKNSEKNIVRLIYGNVRDSANKPIANASVSIMNRSKSVMTGEDGNFTIQVRKEDSALLITSVGFDNKEVKISPGFLHIEMTTNVNPLEEVVVGGNMAAIKRKAETTSLTVIDSKTLDALPVNDISQIYRGLVPGTNSFSPGDFVEENSTLSIRGLSGSPQIALYVDGIEYAGGSGYLFTLNKQNIDRVEVLRGPSSSTLYGTGSNGGILQVYTKQAIPGQSSLDFTASAGFLRSKWVQNDPFQQFYNLESVTGLKKTSVTLGGTYSSCGAFLPDGGGRSEAVNAGVNWNPSDKWTISFTSRYENNWRHLSRNPVFDTTTHPNASAIAYGIGPFPPEHTDMVDESYLIGVNLSYQANSHWTNHLTAGYTQNGYHEIPATTDSGNIPLGRYYLLTVNRATTIRYFNDLQLGKKTNDGFDMHIMSGMEYKKYFYQEAFISANPLNFNDDPPNENYGIFAQANPSYKNIFLTLALRYDHNNLFKNAGSFNPRFGVTTNFNIDHTLIVKPRIAWGSGIIAPSYSSRYGDTSENVVPNPALKPEGQRGFEYGLEFYGIKGKFNFESIYYNNILENMAVLNPVPTSGITPSFQWMNAGVVANTGWEFSASYKVNDHFSMRGTFSAMSSVVTDTTGEGSNAGNMLPGTQITGLPRHTAGLFLTYHATRLPFSISHFDISFNATEVDGVINFDAVRHIVDLAYGRLSPTAPTTAYWKKSGMVIQLGINVDYFLNNDLRFFIQGSNISNNNRFVQSTAPPTYGASWMFGIKYNMTR